MSKDKAKVKARIGAKRATKERLRAKKNISKRIDDRFKKHYAYLNRPMRGLFMPKGFALMILVSVITLVGYIIYKI